MDGCPVLSVHFSFRLARHLGQGTDNIRFNVSFSGCTPILFSINHWSDGQFCSSDFNCPKAETKMGLISASEERNFVIVSEFWYAPISQCATRTQLGWYVRPQMQ